MAKISKVDFCQVLRVFLIFFLSNLMLGLLTEWQNLLLDLRLQKGSKQYLQICESRSG